MINRALARVAIAIVAACLTLGAQQPPEYQSSGSGFIVSAEGLVVTNQHVIDRAVRIEVRLATLGVTSRAAVVARDKINDLALLRLDPDGAKHVVSLGPIPFRLADSSIAVGQEVWTMGFPFGAVMGNTARLAVGTINSLYGLNDDPRLLQISNPIQPGNSGGPLLNRKGELVGVVVSALNSKYFYDSEGVVPQNVNFAVKVGLLRNLLEVQPRATPTGTLTEAPRSLDELVAAIAPFVVEVLSHRGGAAVEARLSGAPTIDELLAQNLASRGGSERLKAISSRRVSGRVAVVASGSGGGSQLNVMPMQVLAKRPDLMLQEMRTQDRRIVTAFDGLQAWAINPSVSKAPFPLQGAQADVVRDQAQFDGPLAYAKQRGDKMEVLGKEAINGAPAWKLVITHGDKITTVYLDEKTALERKVSVSVNQGGTHLLVETIISDYQPVDGIMVPRKVQTLVGGQTQATVTIDRVEYNVALDDVQFRMPAKR
jgi:S1-C subfamily serine protease/outer membrane lipoprotein-sorting protein